MGTAKKAIRKFEAAQELLDTKLKMEELEARYRELSQELIEFHMAPGDTLDITNEDGEPYAIQFVHQEVPCITNMERVWRALHGNRTAFFESVKVNVTQLRRRLGGAVIDGLADRMDERNYLAVRRKKVKE